MKAEKLLLERLVDAYERSGHLMPGKTSQRRVQLRMGGKDFPEYDVREAESMETVHAGVQELTRRGWLTFDWRKGYNGQLLEKVYLNLDALPQIYSYLGRQPKADRAAELQALLRETLPRLQTEWKRQWVADELARLQATLKPSRLLDMPWEQAEALVKVLCYCEDQSAPERVISVACFHDSKYLERMLEAPLVSIARKYEPELAAFARADGGEEPLTSSQVLAQIGILKAPEILEFCGPVTFRLQGSLIHADAFDRGFCINGDAAAKAEGFDLTWVKRILFIENKTNYQQFVLHYTAEDTLLVYHGGFYSPAKGCLLKKLCAAAGAETRFDFWGDIDLGGFAMYERLRRNITPALQPWHMGESDFLNYKKEGLQRTPVYLDKVRAFVEQTSKTPFKEVAECIIETGVTIEQESMLGEWTDSH